MPEPSATRAGGALPLTRRSLVGGGAILVAGYALAHGWGHRPLGAGPAARRTLASVLACQLPDSATTETIEALTDDVEAFLAAGDPVVAGQVRVALAALEHLGGAGPLSFARFSRRTREDQAAIVEAWRRSRLGPKRQIADAMRRIALFTWYAQPSTWAAIGYDGPWVGRTAGEGTP